MMTCIISLREEEGVAELENVKIIEQGKLLKGKDDENGENPLYKNIK